MVNKVIFFVESSFNKRDYDRFGIDLLINNGFVVEVWDFTPFMHPGCNREIDAEIKEYKGYFQYFNKKNTISAILCLDQNCYVVCLVGYCFNSLAIYKALSVRKLKYAVLMALVLPPINSVKRKRIIIAKTKKSIFLIVFNYIFIRIPFYFLGISPVSIILAGGEKSTSYKYPTNNKTEILWGHTLDYDIYLRNKNNSISVDSNTAVFLDSYLPFHPDFIRIGMKHPITANEYYPLLCKCFSVVERLYGVTVVIAAHPRSEYKEQSDYFGGRRIVKNKTIDLVRDSKFVLSHASTAINYAVLFEKPIIFLTTDKLEKSFTALSVDSMVNYLQGIKINIDHDYEESLRNELIVNKSAYSKYKNDYIKRCDSPETQFWQIFAKCIKEYV